MESHQNIPHLQGSSHPEFEFSGVYSDVFDNVEDVTSGAQKGKEPFLFRESFPFFRKGKGKLYIFSGLERKGKGKVIFKRNWTLPFQKGSWVLYNHSQVLQPAERHKYA